FDSEAIAAVREITQLERAETYAAVSSSARLSRLVETEFPCAGLADRFIAVNDFEAAILRQRFDRPVYTIGHHLSARPLGAGPETRSGLLFVGALYDVQSPNYDSLVWFLDHVWPRIRSVRPEETLRIAGFVRPEVSLNQLRGQSVTCLGQVDDLASEYA